MTYGITPTGFNKKPGSVIRTELVAVYKSIYGDDIQLNDGPIAQEIGVFTEREANLWNLFEAVYLAGTRDGATGQSLDNVNALIGVGRVASSNSTGVETLCTLGGSDLTVFSGTQIAHNTNGVEWETVGDFVIPAAVDTVEAGVTDVGYVSGNTVRYTFATGTDLTAVVAGDKLNVTDALVPSNNGLFSVTAINSGAYTVDVTNLGRSDTAGDESGISASGAITDGYIEASIKSVLKGAYAASFGTLESILTPVLGLDFVGNLEAATTGTGREGDPDYRVRGAISTVSTDGGTLAATKAQLELVTGVTAVFARENRTSETDANGLPAKSQQYTVIGGGDADIAAALYRSKGAGMETYGAVGVAVVNDYGDSETMRFSRVTEIDIHFEAQLTTDSNYPTDGGDQVRAALVAYGATLSNGGGVINDTAKGYITYNVPGITAITLLQGLSDPPTLEANLTIATEEIASITTGDIDIT